jgi:primary-amine oxidase
MFLRKFSLRCTDSVCREGLILSNITYDDGVKGTRPLFYRLSVAEMVVPYAKTIYPHHRKHAFDTGEYGIGALANSLALGCDCLGSITYLDFDSVTRGGGIETIKSAICIQSVNRRRPSRVNN